jgi:hypothetical protein
MMEHFGRSYHLLFLHKCQHCNGAGTVTCPHCRGYKVRAVATGWPRGAPVQLSALVLQVKRANAHTMHTSQSPAAR